MGKLFCDPCCRGSQVVLLIRSFCTGKISINAERCCRRFLQAASAMDIPVVSCGPAQSFGNLAFCCGSLSGLWWLSLTEWGESELRAGPQSWKQGVRMREGEVFSGVPRWNPGDRVLRTRRGLDFSGRFSRMRGKPVSAFCESGAIPPDNSRRLPPFCAVSFQHFRCLPCLPCVLLSGFFRGLSVF